MTGVVLADLALLLDLAKLRRSEAPKQLHCGKRTGFNQALPVLHASPLADKCNPGYTIGLEYKTRDLRLMDGTTELMFKRISCQD